VPPDELVFMVSREQFEGKAMHLWMPLCGETTRPDDFNAAAKARHASPAAARLVITQMKVTPRPQPQEALLALLLHYLEQTGWRSITHGVPVRFWSITVGPSIE
jgi:hypothetical protein